MVRFSTLFALGGAAALLSAAPAIAHTRLVSSTPAADASLTAAPRAITLTFNERLVPAFSKVELTMPAHNNMTVPVTTTISEDGKRILSTPRNRLTAGSYKVVWTAAGRDGHKMQGEVAFTIG